MGKVKHVLGEAENKTGAAEREGTGNWNCKIANI